MEWYWVLLLIVGSFIGLLASGIPVAFAFMAINVIGLFLLLGGGVGLDQLILSIYYSLARFTLLPLPLFILMGEVMFHSGIAPKMIDTLDKFLGRMPGRLGLEAVGGGALFATLSGSSMSAIAMLGALLVPEMENRGYKKPMTLGPILGSAGLAIMIPPSGLAVLAGAIGEVSIGRILIGIIIPGVLMATLYAAYIIIRCRLQPSIAPPYEIPPTPWSDKIISFLLYILPLSLVIFLVTGLIFLGIATPTESAATGVAGTFILAAAYKRLNWQMIKNSLLGAARISGMVFMLIAGATAFSRVLAASGASRGLVEFATNMPVAPIVIVILMLVTAIVLGTFMDVGAIIILCLPLFIPVVMALGLDEVWFTVSFLLTIEMGTTSPPFGISLFVMKGVAPAGTTMGDVYKAGLPFLGCDLVALTLMIAFPALVLWLPGLM